MAGFSRAAGWDLTCDSPTLGGFGLWGLGVFEVWVSGFRDIAMPHRAVHGGSVQC